MGWIGRMDQLLHYLAVVGADRHEEGGFKIGGGGAPVVTFMGDKSPDAETVVSDDAVYFVAGKPCNLAHGLGTTSYGMQVAVISVAPAGATGGSQ